jgi:hypothetical protein
MPLKAGTKNPLDPTGYVNSMAEAMEQAFLKEWPFVMHDAPVPQPNDQMKLMFIAISRGVIQHLETNHGSFKVTTEDTGVNTAAGEVSAIDTIKYL